MRIPVYASQAKATNEAPGASIRARMDPNVFVQSELAKGEVLGSAFEQINKYALVRAEAEAKIQAKAAHRAKSLARAITPLPQRFFFFFPSWHRSHTRLGSPSQPAMPHGICS